MSAYRTFTVITDPNSLNDHEVAEVLVGMSLDDDESQYEFTLRWQRGNGTSPFLVEIYDESFQAFVDMPDLFKWLGTRKGATSLTQVKATLKRLGFRDVTKHRTN